MDFTLRKYGQIIEAGLRAGYRHFPIFDWYKAQSPEISCIMLRHDVDRRPENAFEMADLERRLGVRSTYYFRSLPCSFVPAIIEQIHDMGHEIGYHYEDWQLARGEPQRAIELFSSNLARLRKLAPVNSIAMHGSPLARQNNMTIWEHLDYREYDVVDAILSFDYSEYAFFTDTGRTFGPSTANLRDYLGGAKAVASVRSSDDLSSFIERHHFKHIQINVHSERWNDDLGKWARQWAFDKAANGAKRVIRVVRPIASSSGRAPE